MKAGTGGCWSHSVLISITLKFSYSPFSSSNLNENQCIVHVTPFTVGLALHLIISGNIRTHVRTPEVCFLGSCKVQRVEDLD